MAVTVYIEFKQVSKLNNFVPQVDVSCSDVLIGDNTVILVDSSISPNNSLIINKADILTITIKDKSGIEMLFRK